MKSVPLTSELAAAWERDGYVLVPELLDAAETALLGDIARRDHALTTNAMSRADGEGGAVKLRIENELPDDEIYSAVVRSSGELRTVR